MLGQFKIASFSKRLASFYLTLVILLLLTALIVLSIYSFRLIDLELYSTKFWLISLIAFVALLLLDSTIQGLYGANMAKAILSLKLVDDKYHKELGLMRSLLRTFFSFLSLLLLGLGYIAIGFNKDRRSLHDLLSASRVVEIPRGGVLKFLSWIVFVLSYLVGMVMSLALLVLLILTPYILSKSFYDINKYSSLESSVLETQLDATLGVPLSAKRVFSMIEFDTVDYAEFELNRLSKYSYIREDKLKELGVKLLDYDYLFDASNGDLFDFNNFHRAIILPKLILKDSHSKDMAVHNQRFIVNNERNVFGADILELWDYHIDYNASLLSLKLFEGDQAIYKDTALSQTSRDYLLYVLRSIRAQWDEYLQYINVDDLRELSGLKIPPANDIQFELDPITGYVQHITFPDPSKSKAFNKLCEKFFKDLSRFRMMPAELKQRQEIKLDLKLKYKAMV